MNVNINCTWREPHTQNFFSFWLSLKVHEKFQVDNIVGCSRINFNQCNFALLPFVCLAKTRLIPWLEGSGNIWGVQSHKRIKQFNVKIWWTLILITIKTWDKVILKRRERTNMQVIPDLKGVYLNAQSFSGSDILKFLKWWPPSINHNNFVKLNLFLMK